MDLKTQFNKIDVERLILVPVFIFLMLICASGAYSYLMEHSFSDFTSTLHIVHKGLMVCFYLLTVALFFTRSQARATSSSLLARILAYAGTFMPFILIFTRSPETDITLTLLSVSIMTCGMLFALYSMNPLPGLKPRVSGLLT